MVLERRCWSFTPTGMNLSSKNPDGTCYLYTLLSPRVPLSKIYSLINNKKLFVYNLLFILYYLKVICCYCVMLSDFLYCDTRSLLLGINLTFQILIRKPQNKKNKRVSEKNPCGVC